MIDLTLALASAGSALLAGSGVFIWQRHDKAAAAVAAKTVCDVPAPDESLRCTADAGHYGWHTYYKASWYGGVWLCEDRTEVVEPEIEPERPERSRCDVRSADGRLGCTFAAGHDGRHRDGNIMWRSVPRDQANRSAEFQTWLRQPDFVTDSAGETLRR